MSRREKRFEYPSPLDNTSTASEYRLTIIHHFHGRDYLNSNSPPTGNSESLDAIEFVFPRKIESPVLKRLRRGSSELPFTPTAELVLAPNETLDLLAILFFFPFLFLSRYRLTFSKPHLAFTRWNGQGCVVGNQPREKQIPGIVHNGYVKVSHLSTRTCMLPVKWSEFIFSRDGLEHPARTIDTGI